MLMKQSLAKETKGQDRDFPGGPVVKTQPSNAGVVGSIPGQGTEISHAARCGQKLKINKSFFFFLKRSG